MLYRFHLLNNEGRVFHVELDDCEDDLAALAKAYNLCEHHDVQVWRDTYRVAKIQAGCEPQPPKDLFDAA
jgi:hypothetical protein